MLVPSYLFDAAASGKVDQVRHQLEQGTPYDIRDESGATALHYVAMSSVRYGSYGEGLKEVLGLFLNRGLDISVPDNQGATPLHYLAKTASNYNDKEKLNDFLTFGADLNARDNNGMTMLHYTAQRNSFQEFNKFIIEKGGQVNIQDEKGQTPLHLAAECGEAGTIKILLENGADATLLTRDGQSVWDYAVKARHEYLAQVLKAHASGQIRKRETKCASFHPWVLLSPDKVAYTTQEKSIGYRLTEVFNFGARTYTQIAQNLQTKAEGVTVKTFDEFMDTTLLEKAHDELKRLGGNADRELIKGAKLDKLRKGLI